MGLAQTDETKNEGNLMKDRSLFIRHSVNFGIKVISSLSAVLTLFMLGWILYVVASRGLGAFHLDFFLKLPTPPGVPGGGIANAIIGTSLITFLATLIGVPVGILAGIYFAEYGLDSRASNAVRFLANILMGTPSIIIGVFVYTILVMRMGNFSGYAGAIALGIIILPVVVRTTEDMLRLVPNSMRESALALGAPRWKVILGIVFRSAKAGLVTGVLLAIARVSGETAPLLFTALNSPYWVKSLNEPVANLTVTIFNYAMSPYADWKEKAWGASLLIMFGVLGVSILARWFFREKRV
jgi:phosphate transport system permease protein